ncbi:MAG: hypothetical protein NTY90_02490 [Candidatus Micrarchaeota archaeon]|nr:hypothetical protein [Candidatus Micrarchaeota archaeon]
MEREDLAKIVSYLTFDGHLRKNIREFYLSSSSLETLKAFEEMVIRNFGIKAAYEIGTGFGESYKCRFCSAKVSRLLYDLGAPNGDKMISAFAVPLWIKNDKVLAKEYLRVAFGCEAGIRKRTNAVSYEIYLKLHKAEELLECGLSFIDELKQMLLQFGVETGKTTIQKGNLRKKDGKLTKAMSFRIKTNSLTAFAEEIGFSDESKQNQLTLAVKALKIRKTLSYHLSKSNTTRAAFEKQFCDGTSRLEPAKNRFVNGAVG